VRYSSSSSEEEVDTGNIAVESSEEDTDEILASSEEETSEAESSEVENSGGDLEDDQQEGRQKRKMVSKKKDKAKKQRNEKQEEENMVPKKRLRKQKEEVNSQDSDGYQYEVGEFVTAVYEDVWLVAQVDINQDNAGDTHVNLNYMERVGYNQFKWPKNYDLLLTLREDILTRCAPPGLVGSSIRANHVGLNASDAHAADVALAAVPVFYLQPFVFHGHPFTVYDTGTVPVFLFLSNLHSCSPPFPSTIPSSRRHQMNPSPLGAWGGGVVQCLLGKGTVRYWGREESRNEDLKEKGRQVPVQYLLYFDR
jgi:hypothetical protein